MHIESTEDALALLESAGTAAALGAALRRGLFTLLADGPRDVAAVSEAMDVPLHRCGYWLQLLEGAGLLVLSPEGYSLTAVAQAAILDAYAPGTWALLAEEVAERLPAYCDLHDGLSVAGPLPGAVGGAHGEYVAAMAADPDRAASFTRMLADIHAPLADDLADFLDLSGATRLMDLGGGSGVLAAGLLCRHPQLTAVVVDIATVCAAGREVAAGFGTAGRLDFHPADFLADPLPEGCDVVLECDVGVYGAELFRKVRAALPDGGRFFVVDQFAPAPGVAPACRVQWAFSGSLADPGYAFPTSAEVRAQLAEAGFTVGAEVPLPTPARPGRRYVERLGVIEAVR